MSIEQKNHYLANMEAFVAVADQLCDWASKARLFIAELKRQFDFMSAEAFKAALRHWDDLVDQAPKDVWYSYAYSS